MSLIITNKVLKKEFPKGITENEKSIILKNANKELATIIKGKNLPANTSLIKAYATSERGARRIFIYFKIK